MNAFYYGIEILLISFFFSHLFRHFITIWIEHFNELNWFELLIWVYDVAALPDNSSNTV